MIESEYLTFQDASNELLKTKRLLVISKKHGMVLGEVRWFGSWRQYAFFPRPETVWNTGCMADVQKVIGLLMEERKASRA